MYGKNLPRNWERFFSWFPEQKVDAFPLESNLKRYVNVWRVEACIDCYTGNHLMKPPLPIIRCQNIACKMCAGCFENLKALKSVFFHFSMYIFVLRKHNCINFIFYYKLKQRIYLRKKNNILAPNTSKPN